MAFNLVYDTTIKTVDDNGIEKNINTQEFKQICDSLDTVSLSVPDESTGLNIYTGNKDFNFIDIVSDQPITITIKNDGATFFTGEITKFECDYSGTNLTIDVTNASGYSANIQAIISRKS